MLVQFFQTYHLPYNVNIQPLTLIIIILYLMHFLFYLEKINKIMFLKKNYSNLTKNFLTAWNYGHCESANNFQ